MRDDDGLKETLRRIAKSGVFPGQHYRHNETRVIYKVLVVSVNEADLEPYVQYQQFDDPYAMSWSRHLDVFCGQVLRGEALSPRFSLVEL